MTYRLPLLIFVTLLFACSSVQLSTTSDTAKQAYREGQAFEKSAASDRRAIEAYRRALREDARFIEAYEALGRWYERHGQPQSAADQYRLALMVDPNRTGLYLAHGRALFNAEKFQDAQRALQQYIVFRPNDREGLELLAETQRLLDNPRAESTYRDLLAQDSTDAASLRGMAHYYLYTRQYEKALPYYRRVVTATDGLDATTLYEYAYCLVHARQWDEARNQLQSAASISENETVAELLSTVNRIVEGNFRPEALIHYLDASLLYEESQSKKDGPLRTDEILRYLQSSLALEPEFVPALQMKTQLEYSIGQYEDAREGYDRLIHLQAATAEDFANAAYLYFRIDSLSHAKAYYLHALSLDPSQIYIESYLSTIDRIVNGEIHRESYRWYEKAVQAQISDSAEAYLLRALSIDSMYYEPHLQLGIVRLRDGRQREAESAFLAGLRVARQPSIQALFHYNLGLVYLNRDLHDKAVVQFTKAFELDTTDVDPLFQLSQAYRDKSDLVNAVRVHDELLRRRPDYFAARMSDLETVGLTDVPPMNLDRKIRLANRPVIGQTFTYEVRIRSTGEALLGPDARGNPSREVTVVFREQVQDVTDHGVVEYALDVLSVTGVDVTPLEKRTEGKRFYLRVSDLYGVVNIYGLLEDQPYTLARLLINMMADLHGRFPRKEMAEGEMWRTEQSVFKLGTVDAVAVIDDLSGSTARGSKYYSISGSYNAARYGEQGMVHVFNKGQLEFEFDPKQHLVTWLRDEFTTKEFKESTAKLEIQTASYEVKLKRSEIVKLSPPKRVVLSDIPYVKQHGPQCAAASLSMVLSYYKQDIDQDDIYSAIKSDYAGAQSHDIVNYPRSLSYKTYGYIGNLEDLKQKIDQGIPVLVFLSPFGFGHVVVVIGYDESKHQIVMHDPTVANNHAVGYDEFLEEWRQSGNECAIVVPFDREVVVTEGPIATHQAVELKWKGDKVQGEKQYDAANGLYRQALTQLPRYEAALEGVMRVYLSRDQFDRASEVLDTLLTWNPNSIDLVLQNASILLSQYDYDKVLQLTKKTKQLDEMNINNYIFTAIALSSQKQYNEAIEEIKRGIRINPLVSNSRQLLAGFLTEVEDFDQAYEQARLALKYEPENVGNYINLSGIYLNEINYRFLLGKEKADRIKKILEQYEVVAETNPNFPSLDQLYGDTYLLADRYALGDSLLRENIRKYPEDESAYNNLAWHYATENVRLDEAVVLSEKSIELSQRNPYYFDTLAWIHFKLAMAMQAAGKKDSAEYYYGLAEQELKATLTFDKYSDFAYRHLGVVYAAWGKPAQAAEQLEQAISIVPMRHRVCVEIGQDFEEAGLPESGIEYYERALSLKPNIPYAAYRLAVLYAEQNRSLTKAMEYADRALQSDSSSSAYQGAKGIVYYHMKDYTNARTWLEKAVSGQAVLFDKESAANYYYLGLIYRQTKQIEQAKEQFRKYLVCLPFGKRAAETQRYLK